MVAAIKTLEDVRIGDPITLDASPASEALPGYEEPKQMVFCDFYPASSESGSKKTEFETLREAVEKQSGHKDEIFKIRHLTLFESRQRHGSTRYTALSTHSFEGR